MTKPLCLQLATLGVCLSLVAAYSSFQKRIPNGNRVPNPCPNPEAEDVWQGVGHENPAGGGARNPFGLDFAANGYSWKAVCQLDSDGDGNTNGAELGDPDCKWVEGEASPTADILTHPGVCEPLTSDRCATKNSWLTCTKFDCPAVDKPDVKTIEMRLPPTKVPAKETTYMCHATALPQDADYHIIATTPIINTTSLLHHVLIYLCTSYYENDAAFNGAKECFMTIQNDCQSLIGLWGVGSKGQCLQDAYGFRIGKNGFKYAYMEVHWNNPLLDDTLVDSSGMALHYTPTLRPNDAGVVMTGQMSLAIPPGLSSVAFQGTCTDLCTSRLAHPLKITWATIHMHLQGIAGMVELYRGPNQYKVLLNSSFSYNTPPEFDFRQPIEFLPGDEIKVTCQYQTLDRNETTKFGESTSEEMCFAFLTYYPVQPKFTQCCQVGKVEYCSNFLPDCKWEELASILSSVNAECDEFPLCTERCIAYLNKTQATQCLDGGDDERWLKNSFPEDMEKLRNITEHCLPFGAPSSPPSTSTGPSSTPSGASAVIFSSTKRERFLFWLVSICAIYRFRFISNF